MSFFDFRSLLSRSQVFSVEESANKDPKKVDDLEHTLAERDILERKKELLKRLENSQKYRIRLQQYKAKLDMYADELDARADELDEREKEVADKEASFEEREKALFERVKKEAIRSMVEQKRLLDIELEEKNTELGRLQDAEGKILDWASRMEKKERSFFNELLSDVNKYQKYRMSFDGFEFEEYVAATLRKSGYSNVQLTPKSNDYGADIIAETGGIKHVFQCKYYSAQVGIEAVQQVHAAKSFYDAHVAVVVTNSVFTRPARLLAGELGVVLWDGEKLSELTKGE